MKLSKNRNRPKYLRNGIYAVLILSIGFMPLLIGKVYAYGLVSPRSITMNNSAVSATGTTYSVSFNVSTTGNVGGIVVDFCSNTSTPIIGAPCALPSGFSVGAPTIANRSANISTLTTVASSNSGRTLSLAGTGASISSGVTVSFDLTSATNPSTANQTFYAHIFTFATSGAVTTWLGTANGSSSTGIVDAGGIALSTADKISIDFDVAESLTFCVYTGVNCAAGVTPLTLGDTNGVLSTAGPFVDIKTKFDIASNNNGSATPATSIYFKAILPTSGSNTIASIGNSATAVAASNTSQFGLCGYRTGTSALSILPPYNNGSAAGGICNGTSQTAGTGSTGGTNSALFAFNTPSVTGTYGDTLATYNGLSASSGQVALVGMINSGQAAGIYTTTFTYIAVATY